MCQITARRPKCDKTHIIFTGNGVSNRSNTEMITYYDDQMLALGSDIRNKMFSDNESSNCKAKNQMGNDIHMVVSGYDITKCNTNTAQKTLAFFDQT